MTSQTLSAKDSTAFKSLLKLFELKMYKKGLKTAETLLKKHPEHGETLAMKGLFVSNLGKRDEAHMLVKQGLRFHLTSHICWHVYGLLHRSERNYDEAIKCYSHALKYDRENIHIIRDYSLLQMHMRNYSDYVTSRKLLLDLQPGNKFNWFGLAVALHLDQQYDAAIRIIDTFVSSMGSGESTICYEHGEVLLYRNMILEESGDLQGALDHLNLIKRNCVDVVSWKETRARLLIASGAKQEASQIYKQLLDQNNDCKFYFTQLESLQSESLEAFYAELKESYPKSNIIQLALLKNATRDNFLGRLEKYCIPALIKGVPSLFVALKDLYNSEWKIPIIESLFTRFYSSLFETKSLNETPAPPTTAVWILYYQSQHFDLLGNHTLALDFINNAIQHTPTLPDLYMFKARIYKHIGSPALASETMDFARSLDLQDRFVNSKSCKYMLRNENETLALETIKLFTKVDTDVISDLNEMQCIWVSIEIAESCFRNAKYGKALKKYQIIDRYFNDHYDDQFDFHSYCLRKTTLRDYVRLVRYEDVLRKHEFWIRAGLGAVKTFLKLLDRNVKIESDVSVSEQKKLARKLRKEQSKNEKESDKKVKDDDPDGLLLVDIPHSEMLAKSVLYLAPINEADPTCMLAWVYEKYLLAWRCLKKGYSVNKHDPNLMKIAIKFLVKMELVLPTLENEIVRKCLVYELTSHELFPKDIKDSTAYDVFSALLKSNIECVEYIVAACEVLIQVFDKIDEAKSLVEKLNRKRIPVPGYRSARFSTDSVELDKNLVPRVDELLKVLGLELPNLESLTI